MGKVVLLQRKAKPEAGKVTSQEKFLDLVDTVFDRNKYWSHWCEGGGMHGLVGSISDRCEFCGKSRQDIEKEDQTNE